MAWLQQKQNGLQRLNLEIIHVTGNRRETGMSNYILWQQHLVAFPILCMLVCTIPKQCLYACQRIPNDSPMQRCRTFPVQCVDVCAILQEQQFGVNCITFWLDSAEPAHLKFLMALMTY